MIQRPFHSTIEAQPRNITFLTIKTLVNQAHVLGQGSVWTGRGGGGGVSWMAGLCSWFRHMRKHYTQK